MPKEEIARVWLQQPRETAPRQGRQQLVLIFAGVTPRHLQAGLRAKARQRLGLEVGNPNAVV